MSDTPGGGSSAGDALGEKKIARRPEGPAHDRKSGMFATLKRMVTEFQEDNGTDWAAALTYYAVLAVFPALLALISIVGLVADPKTVTDNVTELVTDTGPPSAADTLRGPIEGLTANTGAAGILLIVGLVSALWSASGYIGAFTRASNVIYEVEEGRPIYKLRPLQMLVTLAQVLLLGLIVVGIAVTGPAAKAVGDAFGIGDTAVLAWDIGKWPVMLVLVLLAIGLLYYASPNAKLRGFRSVLPGALLAVVIFLIASGGFAFYLANFGSYNKTYGALGGVITFLVWLWITNVAIVLGAQVNAERERSQEIAEGTPGAERELQSNPATNPSPPNAPAPDDRVVATLR